MADWPTGEVDARADGDAVAGRYRDLAQSGFALAMQTLRNREDAADAVQDAFHRLVWNRRLFDPGRGELRAWFLKIVRNRSLDLLRKRGRRRVEAVELSELTAPNEPPPDAALERREMLDAVKRHLMAMPQDQREIILLRDYHDLSYAQIANVLGIRPGTVMSRLHRARGELRRRMGQ